MVDRHVLICLTVLRKQKKRKLAVQGTSQCVQSILNTENGHLGQNVPIASLHQVQMFSSDEQDPVLMGDMEEVCVLAKVRIKNRLA